MPATQVTGKQVKDGGIQRDDLDVTTVGQALVRKLVQGTGVSLSATGADAGTGDVTISLPVVAPALGGLGADVSGIAKGGLVVGTGASTFGILAVGANGKVLITDSTQATGLRWVDAPTLAGGIICSGNVSGISRTDFQAEFRNGSGSGHAGITIMQMTNPGSTVEEGAVSMSAYLADGTVQQMGSLSMMWADAGATTYRSVLRLHGASYNLGSNADFRLFTGYGIDIFGSSDTTGPGAGIFRVNGTTKTTGLAVTGDSGSIAASIRLYSNYLLFQAGSAGFLFQNSANDATRLTLTDAGALSLGGKATVGGLTVSGDGGAEVGAIRLYSNYMVFQPGTSGYLFQSSSNAATRMQITDAGVVTIGALASGSLSSVAGVITSSSDERLKNITGSLSYGLKEVVALRPIRYRWNERSGLDRDREYGGFGAAQVEMVMPLAVSRGPDGMRGLHDRVILAALVNAVKELEARLM